MCNFTIMTDNTKILRDKRHKINLYTCINLIFLIILFDVVSPDCKGQEIAKLTQPQLTLINDSLIIKYDILDANPNDLFDVRLEITDYTGTKINAATFTGDIGDSIKGGVNKQIIWNLSADNIFLNNSINVEIIANKIIVSEIVTQKKDLTEIPFSLSKEEKELSETPTDIIKKENVEDIKESHKMIEEPVVTAPKVKTAKHLIKSAIFPGWGMTKLSNGKPYWLMGVAGAGCIASSIYFNQQAYSNYNNYLDSNDEEKIDTYFDNAKTQDNLSKAFAITAAVIWVTDLAIVGIKANSMNKSFRRSRLNAFSFGTYIESNTDTPILSLYFNF